MAQSISQEAVVNTGLPGATAASRYAGATTSGAPTTGTFAVGDYVVDQTGAMYVCTVAGTPGTWQLSGVSVNENIAGKNFVINGGMDIWQRGTSFTNAGSTTANTADRWVAYRGGFSTGLSVSRQPTSDTTNLPFIQYCARVQRASGDTQTAFLGFQTTLETSNSIPMAGKIVTLSFWARAGANFSSTSNQLNASVVYGTGTDQNYITGFTGFTQIVNVNVTLTSTWKLYSFTGTVGSIATQLAISFGETPTGTAGANDYFDITGVQLEIAPQATPFSRAGGSIGGELALCQRYFYKVYSSAATSINEKIAIGQATSGTTAIFQIPLPITMRLAPSGTISSLGSSSVAIINSANTTAYGCTSFGYDSATPNNVSLTASLGSSLLTAGNASTLLGNANGWYLGFSAEL